jgi:hypothetical protein
MPLGLGLMMGLGHNVAASGGGGAVATTWDTANSSSHYTYSNSNKTAISGSGGNQWEVFGSASHSGTGDWWYDVVHSGGNSTFVGLASSFVADGTSPVSGSTALVQWWSTDGNLWKGGSSVASPSAGYDTTTDTTRIRLKNNKIYLATVSGGTPTWRLGDPAAETGGYDVSAMGALYPACSTNAAHTFAADFTNW